MEHQDLLQTFAEVAVAFAGFSAVVSIFDRRAESDDPRVRHYRIRVMVEYSLCVSIFSFVPYLLNALLASEAIAWRASSALLAISWSAIAVRRMCASGVCQRTTSEVILGIRLGSERSRSSWSGN